VPGETEENHIKLYQDTLCLGQDSNWAPPEYNSEIKITRRVTRQAT